MTLAEMLEAAAEEVLGAVATRRADGVEYAIGGRPFARIVGGAAEFRLDPAVAGAARRTPDTAPSAQGPEWVRFAPATLDDHAEDRAVAWFESAARRARG